MTKKKDRSRFSLKFNEHDPAHQRTISILESQGQRNISPFIVNAVLHYVQCKETPGMSYMLSESPQPVMDTNEIKEIVEEILLQWGLVKQEPKREQKLFSDTYAAISKDNYKPQDMISDNKKAMIAQTLLAFRKE